MGDVIKRLCVQCPTLTYLDLSENCLFYYVNLTGIAQQQTSLPPNCVDFILKTDVTLQTIVLNNTWHYLPAETMSRLKAVKGLKVIINNAEKSLYHPMARYAIDIKTLL